MSRTLIDISRLATAVTWPSVAVEVNGYLQSWITGANAEVSQHQPRSSIVIGHYDLVLDPQGLLDTPPPLIKLPAPLYIGATTTRSASNHFGKATRPDG